LGVHSDSDWVLGFLDAVTVTGLTMAEAAEGSGLRLGELRVQGQGEES
jgi:hypothetical protein